MHPILGPPPQTSEIEGFAPKAPKSVPKTLLSSLLLFLLLHFPSRLLLFLVLLRFQVICETPGPQKSMNSFGKPMIFTFASFSLPTRPRSPKRCPNSPQNDSQSTPKGSPEQPRSFQGRPRRLPETLKTTPRALQEDPWEPKKPRRVLLTASRPHF